MTKKSYDVIIIGAGHAGCEAALASSRMGMSTLLVTFSKERIGYMSCNPAIGGIGKGQLVKEVDALGGEMAKAADACGIQFRTLNASKGPAVQSTRAQIDMARYTLYMRRVAKEQERLDIIEDEAVDLFIEGAAVNGIETAAGQKIRATAVVITPGTFLNGLIHIGMRSFPGGRMEDETSSVRLSERLRAAGFKFLRFKTGTCARLDGKTIDFSGLSAQDGDPEPKPFSFSTKKLSLKQVPCYITYTNSRTHDIINANLDRSPLYSGKITGTGVRYCPSLEDKVVKFSHHDRHQVFLEPEGLDTDEYYPNGLSTSLPEDTQEEFIRSVPGLERVKINRFGYGIEHDVVDSTQLLSTLESKAVKNLYFAGQINGTTGYEEAAAQGLIAGMNAALRAQNKEPLDIDRSTSYIGVLLDDLVTKGTNEPYRMFTSRVEYRLVLREDNADLRLRETGFRAGLVTKADYDIFKKKEKSISVITDFMKTKRISHDPSGSTLYQLIKRPGVEIDQIREYLPKDASPDALKEVEVQIKYSGYIERQISEIKGFKDIERVKIPHDLDYGLIPGISREIKEKMTKVSPANLGQASRISGITPAAIAILMVYIKKHSHGKTK